jgi:hypothetical protein
MKQSPCFNCITVAICRHRLLDKLLSNCELVRTHTEFIYRHPIITTQEFYKSDNYNFDRLVEVFQALQPTKWSLDNMYNGR